MALFPTGRSTRWLSLTPLQELLGERSVQSIHFVAATVFISSLGVISFFFGVREGARPTRQGAHTKVLAELPLDLRRNNRAGAGMGRSHEDRGMASHIIADRRGSVRLGVWCLVANEGSRARHPSRHVDARDARAATLATLTATAARHAGSRILTCASFWTFTRDVSYDPLLDVQCDGQGKRDCPA